MLPHATKHTTKFSILFLIVLVAVFNIPSVYATTETRYMTSTHLGLSDFGNELNTTQSTSPITVIIGTYDNNVYVTQYLGIRVWLNHSDKSLTEVTSGTAIAIASWNATAHISANWSCPQTSMVTTDSVQIQVYANDFSPPTTQKDTYWQTEALSTTVLNSATWTVYYYLSRAYNSRTRLTTYSFGFGSSAMNSRIENFKYGEAAGAWNLVESWTGQIITREWSQIELWNGTLLTRLWQKVELWNGTLLTRLWQLVEVWNGQLFTRSWKQIETWLGVINARSWQLVEVWTGVLGRSWQLVETWLGELGGEEVFLFFELWMDVLWIPLVSVPFLLALWFSRRREEDE